jgi:hypothetical protein
MGPTAEVVTLESIADEQLLAIDGLLSKISSKIVRTRKGSVWALWIGDRQIDIAVTETGCIVLAAGCNSEQDYDILRQLGQSLATLLHGMASEPIK